MKANVMMVVIAVLSSLGVWGQDISGLSYCLLFDSKFEKQVFQEDQQDECDPLVYLLAHNPEIDSLKYAAVNNELLKYIAWLQSKRPIFHSNEKFLRFVFYRVHGKYLKHYQGIEGFHRIFSQGKYNCASGAALYAFILSHLGYAPIINETRYHVFVTVELDGGEWILFEATDPVNGFIQGKMVVGSWIADCLNREANRLTATSIISAPFNKEIVWEDISLKELAGLHYYNVAVDLINHENYYDAFRALKKAALLYPGSDRIQDFMSFTYMRYETQLSMAFANK